MALEPTQQPYEAVVPTFEVERFAFEAPDRLVVIGRWFGIRGRRFVRPTLLVVGAPGLRPLLAVLEHKPWAPIEDEEWIAAFPWTGGPIELEGAELAVAPDIAVSLPAPKGMKAAPDTKKSRRRFNRGGTEGPDPKGAEGWHQGATPGDTKGADPSSGAPGDTKGADPLVATSSPELERAKRRIEELTRERDAAERERDNAIRSREAAYEARDAALAAREELRHERDALDRDVHAGVEARFAPERDRLEAALAAAEAERDAAIGERDVAVAERDAALDARQAATVARKAAERDLDEAQERTTLRAAAAAAPAAPRRTAVDWTYRTLIVISIALALLLFGVVLSAFL